MKSMLAMAVTFAAGLAQAEPPSTGRWAMRALLDGNPIGTHVFTVTGPADRRAMEGKADFTVKLLGITAYRYHHTASERWQGDCLRTLAAATDDDGKKTEVALAEDGTLTGPQGSRALPGCVMTFAYWNPAILKASRLLNPQSGKHEAITVVELGTDTIEVRGAKVDARHVRLDGPERPIELWYSAGGDWLGLDSMVGKRRLSYRLE